MYSLNKILQACVLAPIKTTYDLHLDLFMKNMGQLKADSTLQQSALTYFECVKRRVYPAHIIPNDYKHLMQYTLSIKWQIMASTYQSRKLVQNDWHSRFKKIEYQDFITSILVGPLPSYDWRSVAIAGATLAGINH